MGWYADVDQQLLGAFAGPTGTAADGEEGDELPWDRGIALTWSTGVSPRHMSPRITVGVKAFEYRRVKNDVRDALDLADLLRMGRLSGAWIAPPPTRELRELVRHGAKLVGLRSHCKDEVHCPH